MNYISVKQVIDDVYDDPLMKDLSFERMINYIVEFMKIIGTSSLFEDKVAILNITQYKAALPNDFYELNQIRDKESKIPYIPTMETFDVKVPYCYKIQGSYIYISDATATLELSYKAFKVDNDGYPYIIDNASFIRALELYIQKRYYTLLFNRSKIPQLVLQNTQQEYAFAVGQAQSDLIRPDVDHMEAIHNFYNSLLPRTLGHFNSFKGLTRREALKF